jgi:hypothetical protein
VAAREWIVEASDAFAVWEATRKPSADDKGAMAAWLRDCEQHGPPPADDIDDRGNLTARGPGGQPIRFRRFDFPTDDPPGYMFVMQIG